MNDDISTARSVSETNGAVASLRHWLLLGGNRLVIAGLIAAATFVTFYGLVALGVLAVGPRSSASTAFGSGLISGTLTLVTVALSINQLILSRVFGSPNELRNRLDGTRELRGIVRDRAGETVTPNDPAAFLGTIGRALTEHARRLESVVDATTPAAVGDYAAGIAAYGESIEENVTPDTPIVDVLDVILGPEYAGNLTATGAVRTRYGGDVAEEARDHVAAIDDLMEAIAVSRQFFKTIALQQDFARLSRILASSGVVAVLTSLAFALVYRSSGVTVDPGLLPVLVPLGIGVVVFPLAAFISYVLRAATIARRTVSVGPFVPPQEQSTEE